MALQDSVSCQTAAPDSQDDVQRGSKTRASESSGPTVDSRLPARPPAEAVSVVKEVFTVDDHYLDLIILLFHALSH